MYLGDKKFRDSGGGIQLFTLFVLYYIGIILGVTTMHLFLGEEAMSTVHNIRISHAIQGVFLFLVPATIYAALFTDTRGEFLVKAPISLKTLSIAVLLIFSIQIFVETVNHYNNLITLPESMSSLDEFFKQTKESGEKTLKLLFADKSIGGLLINILVIAVLPGIIEELFFRGCMQRSIFLVSKNTHIAVWMTAIIFSLLHFQLAGLFPRIILGAVLGYLYMWTKNIWIPIVVHVIHNATIVIVAQMFLETDFYKKISISDYSLSNAGVAAFISLALSLAIMFFIYKNRPKEELTDNQ